MRLTFCGAAGEVTGSSHLLESGGMKILIDCGLKQGSHFADEANFEAFPYDPKEIKAVFVTHAHIDHVGRIPKLMKEGFRGPVYSTPPTKDFAELLLLDSEHLLRQVAEEMRKPPLYVAGDIAAVMTSWHGAHYGQTVELGPFKVTFFDAGHILGSSFVRVEAEGKSIVFSGDLGNVPAPLLRDTEPLPPSDYLVMESTYGGRVHAPPQTSEDRLEEAILETVRRGGVLMIPAFSMERTQDLLLHFHHLIEAKRIPPTPVFMDSPLAIKLTTIYEKYGSYFDKESFDEMKMGDDLFTFPGLHYSLTTEESKEINHAPAPKIIIAGSGMSNGGRILQHERRYLPDPKSCLLIVGFQSMGTLGRQLQEGARMVRILGENIPVRAEVRTIHSYSAHADQPHLLAWVKPRAEGLKAVFLVHGEEDQRQDLMLKLKSDLGLNAVAPHFKESVEL